MADEQDSQRAPEYGMTHPPLPYLVTIRSVTDDDSAPRVMTYKVVAYSILEAIIAATVEAGGSGIVDKDKHQVLYVHPDLETYGKMFGKVMSDIMAVLSQNQ